MKTITQFLKIILIAMIMLSLNNNADAQWVRQTICSAGWSVEFPATPVSVTPAHPWTVKWEQVVTGKPLFEARYYDNGSLIRKGPAQTKAINNAINTYASETGGTIVHRTTVAPWKGGSSAIADIEIPAANKKIKVRISIFNDKEVILLAITNKPDFVTAAIADKFWNSLTP